MTTLDVRADPAEWGFDPVRLARVSEHFERYVADGRLVGALITVSRAGQLVLCSRLGLRDRERALPVEENTIWRIYSMTKPVTSVAAMMLYEEGRFDLTDEVSRWIPEWAEPRVYVGGSAAEPDTAPASGPVRVWHLLTHTAGLTYGFQRRHVVDEIYRGAGYDFGWPKGRDLPGAAAELATLPLLFDPGTAWNYSEATGVVGRLVELWSGVPFDRFVRERILDPLAMDDTDWFVPEEKTDRLAQLYLAYDRACIPFEDLAKFARRRAQGADGGGGLCSSAADYQRFMEMLAGGGELDGVRLLSARSVELMTRNHLPGGGDLATVARDSYAEAEYAGIGFGLGFSVVLDQVANLSLAPAGTFGWGGAAATTFRIDPAEELTYAFYTQAIPTGTYPISRELGTLVYQSLVD
jgi:CubicO group peptidase (beta-lactamase class C family)